MPRLARILAHTLAKASRGRREGNGVYSTSKSSRRWCVYFWGTQAVLFVWPASERGPKQRNRRPPFDLNDHEFEQKLREALAPLGCKLPKNWLTLER